MKRIVLSVLSLMFMSFALHAQKSKTPTTTPPVTANTNQEWKAEMIQLQKDIYKRSAKYGDADQAKNALYHLMVLDSTGASYKDSLMILYFSSQAYVNTVLLGREILVSQPKNTKALSLVATSEQSLGAFKEALEHYKSLYVLTSDPLDLYQIATIEFRLERFGECKGNVEQIILHPKAKESKIYIAYNEKEGQEVPLIAAAWNLRGFIAASKDQQVDVAKQCYQKALELDANFALAKSNLEALDKKPTEAPKK
ncbi:MAG: hypothetical protein ACKVTZ_06615 [Bacteroidia bacterium]